MLKSTLVLIASVLCFSACSGARVFYQDQQGGILVVQGSEDGMMAAAREKMNAHCGSQGYTIVKRFTVVVGGSAEVWGYRSKSQMSAASLEQYDENANALATCFERGAAPRALQSRHRLQQH